MENQAAQLLGFVLTSLGRLVMFSVKDGQFQDFITIDANADPLTMKLVDQPEDKPE